MGAWQSKLAPETPSPWPALTPEIADHILRHLSLHADRIRFPSVCRQWRQAAAENSRLTLPPPLPWLLLQFHGNSTFPQLLSFPDGKLHYFSFLRELDYTQSCLGSFGSWLLFEDPCPSRQNTLWNPLTGATMQLPKVTSTYFSARKVIVCSPELIAGILRYNDHQDLVLDIVVFCRPGMSSWSTGLLCDYYNRCYQDMAFYEGSIYAVTTSGDLFVHEVAEDVNDTLEARFICRHEKVIQGNNNTFDWPPPISNHCYLVISCTGKLLMVQRLMSLEHNNGSKLSGKKVRVFEADFENSQWLEVESLGDQVLFVSSNCSRALSAYDHGSYLKGSTIYFLRDAPAASDRFFNYINPYVDVCGVYDMCSKTICPNSLGQLHTSGVLKAAWFFP